MDKITVYKRNAFIIILLILSIGIYMVYDASNVFALYHFNDSFYYLKRQLLFAVIGLIGLVIPFDMEITW